MTRVRAMTWLSPPSISALAATLCCSALCVSAAAQDVGVTGAVNPGALATPPAGVTRTLTVGESLSFEEEIETDGSGQTQVIFLDQSTLTVGPNSYLIIDEFVFDPATADGSLSISLERGLVRYVGGEISKQGNVQIATDVATIGIRGGMAIIDDRERRTEAVNLFGRLTICPGDPAKAGGGQEDCSRVPVNDPGEFVIVEEEGITGIGQISQSRLEGFYRQFQGGQRVIAAKVVEQGVSGNEGADPSSNPLVDPLGSGRRLPPPVGDQLTEINDAVSDSVTEGIQEEAIEATDREEKPPIPPNPQFGAIPGFVVNTPAPYVDSNGRPFTDPLAQNALGGPDENANRTFDQGVINDGQFLLDVDGDGLADLVLPFEIGDFEVSLDQSNSPFGPLSGTGKASFFDGSEETGFLLYDLVTVDGDNRVRLFGGFPTPEAAFAPRGFRVVAYAVAPDPVFAVDLPFTPKAFAEQFPNAQMTDFLVATAVNGPVCCRDDGPVPLNDGPPQVPDGRSATLWMALSVEGQGAQQKSMIQLSVGEIVDPGSGRPAIFQRLNGTFLDSSQGTGGLGAIQTQVSTLADGDGNSFFGPRADVFVLSNNGPFGPDSAEPNAFGSIFMNTFADPNGEVFGYTHLAERTAAPEGLGEERRQTVGRGYAVGIGTSRAADGTVVDRYVMGSLDRNLLGLTLPQQNSVAVIAEFNALSLQSGTFIPLNSRWAFGDPTSENSAYIDKNVFAAVQSNENYRQGYKGQINPVDTDFGFSSYFASDGVLSPLVYFPNVTPCECEYLSFGVWGGTYEWGDDSSFPGRQEEVHMGTWVAGGPVRIEEIAGMKGRAYHQGHVFGTVALGDGTQYLAAGNYQQMFDFATDRGAYRVTDFDGRNYNNGTIIPSNPENGGAHFRTQVPAFSQDGFAATVNGSFFPGGGDPVAQAGGSVLFTDTQDIKNYTGVTTFAADRVPPPQP